MTFPIETAPEAPVPPRPLHAWELSPAAAIALQRALAGRVRTEPLPGAVRLVAGTDCTWLEDSGAVLAAAVLWDVHRGCAVAVRSAHCPCRFPYVPGLLSFREAPAVLAALAALPQPPDLVLCDGHGLAHPRGLGLASHLGLWLDRPTIGVAKSLLCGEHRTPGSRRGCRTQLLYHGRVVGVALRTRDGVRPLFVSVGHRVTLADAVRWVLRCGGGCRLPEPNRLAHLAVSALRRPHD